ncbi:uncharacterized protein LOC111337088 [Stylophora pistillata]|uniref:uncharacterized protein LOC111337088 n=1 Tax=Stylophora pistillata TaxID=50429 RepID=UPI000C03FFE2|nr:uncharacterized protein LOC111337088 [Stylophora pistillata]
MSLYEEIRKCTHILEVYTIIGCSVSVPTTLKYTYPGCQNITSFPKDYCYKFDPPEAPMGDRMATNIRLAEPMTPAQDYRFFALFTWDPPVYPYKNVTDYRVTWSVQSQHSVFMYKVLDSVKSNSASISDLLPGMTYKIKVYSFFQDRKPGSEFSEALFTTPGVDPNKVKVTHLTAGQFIKSSDGSNFSVLISWEKPIFNYSSLVYKFSYKVDSKDGTEELRSNHTYFNISGILHGTLVRYWVTPHYLHDWIKGVQVFQIITAPVPSDRDTAIKNLKLGEFVRELGTSRYSVNVTWTGPVFNFTLVAYNIAYEFSGYQLDAPTVRITRV